MKKELLLASLLGATLNGFSQQKPNIVVLFVDDWGWADLGNRNSKFHTPNIDQLKKDGLEFTRAYISTATSSPSRATLLTGKEAVRMQMVRHIYENKEKGLISTGGENNEFQYFANDPAKLPSRSYLPLKEVTYAERLKEMGYYNMFVGKWHLGEESHFPTKQGFDAMYGTCEHGHPSSYYPPFFKTNNPFPNAGKNEYLTDLVSAGAERFIKEYNKTQPFSLTVWYYGVHGPQVGRKDYVEQYKKEGLTGKDAEYAAMVSTVDESIGRIRLELKAKGIEKNTVIILYSDQGGEFSNAPLRGGKIGGFTICEGGSRVPLIVLYPGITKAGSVTETPVQNIDIYPTIVEIASGKKCKDKGVNGVSLMPILKGGNIKSRNLYFFRGYEDQYCAIMNGDWKLIKYHSGLFEFYNLKTDVGETTNLVDLEVKKANKMKKELAEWENEVVKNINKINR
ncbi:MAG: sulfatase [Paludibacter sp.]|nr:sulfatase [Paludibacter sp.]